MKRGIWAFLIIFLCVFSLSNIAFASSTSGGEISIDGNFDDWSGKPSLTDTKHDIKSPSLDFTGIQYFSDDQYLYLRVDRQAAKKSEPWDFKVVMLNAELGQKHLNYPFGSDKPVYAPQFEIKSYYTGNSSSKGTAINVSFDGMDLETTFSAANNGKNIEFRVPLEMVGLSGQNKQVEFMVGSAEDSKTGEVDWVPDGEKIVVTTGPVMGKWWQAIFFTAGSILAYGVFRKNKV